MVMWIDARPESLLPPSDSLKAGAGMAHTIVVVDQKRDQAKDAIYMGVGWPSVEQGGSC